MDIWFTRETFRQIASRTTLTLSQAQDSAQHVRSKDEREGLQFLHYPIEPKACEASSAVNRVNDRPGGQRAVFAYRIYALVWFEDEWLATWY